MTDRADTDTQRSYARLAGFMFLFVLASSIAGLIVTSSVPSGSDFAERSAQIMASESLYRAGLVLALIGSLATVLLAVAIYVTVRPVDRNLALVALLFRVCESAIGATGLALSFGILQLRSATSGEVVDYLRSLPSLWADAGPDGRQALATAIFARTDVMGFERLEYDLTPDAVELGLDAALPAVFELTGTIGEFGRGERVSPSRTQRSLSFVMVNATPREPPVPLELVRSA